jgi:LytS/YehU family sensor histidine kinase
VEMIRNYIALQNLRSFEKDKIKLEVIGETKNTKIAPLLFLPFVENSFKHGLKGETEDVFVRIKIEVVGKKVNFEIENSKGQSIEMKDTKYKGIGIENVRKRLELIYPIAHSLQISDIDNRFKVILSVQLK